MESLDNDGRQLIILLVIIHDHIHNKDKAMMYMDGIKIAEKSSGGLLTLNTLNLSIGGRPNGSHKFNGSLDDDERWKKLLLYKR